MALDKVDEIKAGPLVSVVTVVYNGVRGIEETIKSILEQEYGSLEYIIIDGGSTDGTLDIIKKYASRLSYWASEPDKGIYDAMNKGIQAATGEWINFMNCGDRFFDKKVLNLFNNPIQADIICGNAIMEYPTFQTVHRRYPVEKMWKHSPFCHQATFIKTSVMKALKYDTRYRIGADYDFFYRAYLSGKKFQYVNDLICRFDGRDGTTVKNIVLSFHEMIHSSLSHRYTFGRWLYFRCLMMYIHTLLLAKRMAGKKLTLLLTRIAKGSNSR